VRKVKKTTLENCDVNAEQTNNENLSAANGPEDFHKPLSWSILPPLKTAGAKPVLAGETFSLLRLAAMTIYAAPTRTVPGRIDHHIPGERFWRGFDSH
jgi:hypothetical protein